MRQGPKKEVVITLRITKKLNQEINTFLKKLQKGDPFPTESKNKSAYLRYWLEIGLIMCAKQLKDQS